MLPLQGSGQDLSSPLQLFVATAIPAFSPWLVAHHSAACLPLHITFSLCPSGSLCPSLPFLSLRKTSVIGFKDHFNTLGSWLPKLEGSIRTKKSGKSKKSQNYSTAVWDLQSPHFCNGICSVVVLFLKNMAIELFPPAP